MRPDDIWVADPLDGERQHLNVSLVEQLRLAPIPGASDLEAAIALARVLHEEFARFGTDGSQQLTDQEARDALQSLRSVLKRLGVKFDPPFRDLTGFRAYWGSHGGYGSWAARRGMLQELFDPVHAELERLEDEALAGELGEPVSPRKATGWPDVDAEIAELRHHFHNARSPQDYRNIGNDVVAVLEKLSEVAYDPARHLRPGEAVPPVTQTKNRLARVVETDFPGEGSDELVKLAKATVDLAQAVKHNAGASRVRAGVAADAVIQLANMMRRVVAP
jgi:hypothetical protein